MNRFLKRSRFSENPFDIVLCTSILKEFVHMYNVIKKIVSTKPLNLHYKPLSDDI